MLNARFILKAKRPKNKSAAGQKLAVAKKHSELLYGKRAPRNGTVVTVVKADASSSLHPQSSGTPRVFVLDDHTTLRLRSAHTPEMLYEIQESKEGKRVKIIVPETNNVSVSEEAALQTMLDDFRQTGERISAHLDTINANLNEMLATAQGLKR